MKSRMLWVGVFCVSAAIFVHNAAQADYVATFSSSVEGWQCSQNEGTAAWQNSAGSDGEIGWVQMSRGTNAYASAIADASSGGAFGGYIDGSLETKYGTLIDLSFEMKHISGDYSAPVSMGIEATESGYCTWNHSFTTPLETDWTGYSVSINTKWTDAEAKANGWTQEAGTRSWQDVMAKNYRMQFFDSYAGGSGIDNVFGIDTVSIQSAVPEPGSCTLCVGAIIGLMAYAWRRRK